MSNFNNKWSAIMDILDDFPEQEKIMNDESSDELIKLMRLVKSGRISVNNYYKKLAEFWTKQGFPEWAEECYKKSKV